ncbi:c-type cytochrome [Nitratireductor sp. GISD-1A_MAKvit]|uniref:c-type cytochrome n=1 Tax=Nitratireductor sp. GISD-1A_MAKvit TaxID=3234198 RepID=UPI003465114C
MRLPLDLRWRRGLLWLVIFLAAGLLGGALFILSGIYNVSASVRHFLITEKIINFTLDRSIAFHSDDDQPENVHTDGMARLGARHFELGCAPCHGRPEDPPNPVALKMYPAPPDLAARVDAREDTELAWIVENGLKFTGMPAWTGEGRGDEVWPLVAFLRRLPGMTAPDYARLAGRTRTSAMDEATRCIACHGDAEAPPIAPMVPNLSGQSQPYLERALLEYRRGVRQSGMMEPIAAEMSDESIKRLSRYFASQPAPAPSEGADTDTELGKEIAHSGIPQKQIPACLSCHGEAASPSFPKLAGLSADYITQQLALFRSGKRSGTAYSSIMAMIAARLTPEQMDQAARYLSGPIAEKGTPQITEARP